MQRTVTHHKLSASLNAKYTTIRNELYAKFESNQYNILSDTDIIAKANTYNKRNVTPAIISKDVDFFCNVLSKTAFLDTNSNWGERLYCITHNITSPVLTKSGNLAKYINSKKGYSVYANKSDESNIRITEILDYITSNGYTIEDNLQNTTLTNKKYLIIRCNKCNETHEQFIKCGYWKNLYCENCYGSTGRSALEDDIINFLRHEIKDIEIQTNWIIPNSRKEIDIYLPKYNVGIELCGVLWHSYGVNYPNTALSEKQGKHKHLNKLELCEQNNIQLLTIFDNEWMYKSDITKAIILSKLGIYKRRLYGRQCYVKEIERETKRNFLHTYHLQGNCNSQYYYGLYNTDNELLSVMTFGKRQISRGAVVLEMIRYCTISGVQVIGGASKLLSYAIDKLQKYDILKTYCDRRYSNGKFYEKLGFKLKKISVPNFWVTKDCKRLYHRLKVQKHKLGGKDIYDLGYRKIYDCGNFVYEMQIVKHK